jgi:hypothetical protein
MTVKKINNNPEILYSHLIILNLVFGSISVFILSESIGIFGNGLNLLNFPIQIANIFLAIFFLSFSLAFRNQKKTMALFWTFQLIFFGLTGLLNILDPAPYYLTQITTFSDLQKASLFTFIAQIFVAVAQVVFVFKQKREKAHEFLLSKTDYQRVKRKIRNILVLYVILLPVVINSLGGTAFLLRRTRFGLDLSNLTTASQSIFESILYVPPLICLLTLLYFGDSFEKPRKTLIFLLVWIVFLSNPLANPRQVTLFLLLPIVFYFLRGKRIATNSFFVGIPFLLVYSANLVDRFTGQFNPVRFTILSRNGDFDSFAQFASGIKLTDNDLFPYFQQILGSILFFVPRSIWDSKPRDTGVEIANALSLKFQNISAPWILEAYSNARLLGLILTSIFVGFYLSKYDLGSLDNLRSWLLGSVLTGVLFILLRGSLLQATGRVIFSFLLVYYITYRFKIKSF